MQNVCTHIMYFSRPEYRQDYSDKKSKVYSQILRFETQHQTLKTNLKYFGIVTLNSHANDPNKLSNHIK